MLSVIGYTSQRNCINWVCGASEIIEMELEKDVLSTFHTIILSKTHSGSTGRVQMTPRTLYQADAVVKRSYKPKKLP